VCKRANVKINQIFEIGGKKYEIVLVSFGDIRVERAIYGENPIAA
jgi:hypothetical protein